VCRHFGQPVEAGLPVGGIGLAGSEIDLAGDGLIRDGLLLLPQQRDQLLLLTTGPL